ncbi:MAG: hypothetical protein A2201_09745 [Alicyclobacillus sp. RIFOXYA1_FULL_53_8]|nr:MAG: hypothetical protein A2201_09745 [Alicyclobacillus sp. RIFOXYA1_FULL_53_8]
MKQQLSQLQFIFLMLWVVMGNGVLFLPSAVAQFVVRDGWMSAVLLSLSIVVLTGVAVLYVRTFSSHSLVQSLVIALGPWIGRLLGIYYLLWLSVSTCMFLRKFTFYVEDTILPQTPPAVLAALFIIPIAYATWHGIEIMGRLAEIITPLATLVTAGLSVLIMSHVDFSHITPILADGWTPVLRGAVIPWRFSTELMLCLMFLTSVKDPSKSLGRNLLLIGLLLTVFGVVAEVLIVGVLGQQVTHSEYPILEAVRTIQLGAFLGRLDPLYAMGTVMILILKLTVYQYAWLLALKDLFQLPSYRPILASGTFALWAGSMILFHDLPSLDQYGVDTVPAFFASALVVLPLVAVLTMAIRKWLGKLPPTSN